MPHPWPSPHPLAGFLTRPPRLVLCYIFLVVAYLIPTAQCMTPGMIQELRRDVIDLFYHGFDNYMEHAFPEDELKPLTCQPLTRDWENPGHIEVNDVLGNYSLTLIDSLSTLAILASSADDTRHDPLRDFQNGIESLVHLYGDGSDGPAGQGARSRGFDLDSKVQVFETVIRGVGGLLSAHLFAIGELPIRGYNSSTFTRPNAPGAFFWPNGFIYNDQLLRLARDLANRLLPAFVTPTGLPYPRVNLRSGVPFYPNSPLNAHIETCDNDGSGNPEITETCSAGAGSLVLEFSLLTRLTGDIRYEQLAKRAFFAVWERRSVIGLIGAGIDAETGLWVAPFTGIGAGIDSFFEYAVKTHIMLSNVPEFAQSNQSQRSPDFLDVWHDAHSGIKRHLYRGAAYQHPHYIQGDVYTGATRAYWIDSLSAYYPGLLTLSGHLDEAIETHMLFSALWTRYSALPERWNVASGTIDQGLKWWPGRPEFIESTWYLYRATQDPWYLHVGEMVLRDIEQRCWVQCGWAGLEDVRTGELKDRMESFFLGETAKYLALLFDPSHPLNHWDAPFVFTTEGHPLIVPKGVHNFPKADRLQENRSQRSSEQPRCPVPPLAPPFSNSAVAARTDFFHAAALARLHGSSVESSQMDPNIAQFDRSAHNGYTLYPWTLPSTYLPPGGISMPLESRVTFDLSFPTVANSVPGALTLRRVGNGVSINSVSGIKLSMIREGSDQSGAEEEFFRITAVSHLSLGRDEAVTITPEVLAELNPIDPYFTRNRELSVLDLVIDSSITPGSDYMTTEQIILESATGLAENLTIPLRRQAQDGDDPGRLQGFLQQLSSLFKDNVSLLQSAGSLLAGGGLLEASLPYHMLEAATGTGPGAGPLPDVPDATLARPSNAGRPGETAGAANVSGTVAEILPWKSIYIGDECCSSVLPAHVPREFQVIVMRRGGCSFGTKLRNIPSYTPGKTALQAVVIVSGFHEADEVPPGSPAIRPLLEEVQRTPNGLDRAHQIPVLMVEGGVAAYEVLKRARGIGIKRRYWYSSQGLRIENLFVV